MKKILIASLLACSMLTSACNTVPVQLPSTSQTTIDEKALYSAEAAYYGVARLAELAVDSGKLRGANAAKVMDLNRRTYDALVAARSAQRFSNAVSYKLKVAEVLNLVGEIQQVLNQKQLSEGRPHDPG